MKLVADEGVDHQIVDVLRAAGHDVEYGAEIYWSRDDDACIAEVPELPGCAADGRTYEEALQNAAVVIQEWIDTARSLGRPIPEPKGRLMFA